MIQPKKVRYMIDAGAPFSLHSEGLSIKAITRKSEIPVTVEIEGITRKVLVQFQEAIAKELARREQNWAQQRQELDSQAQTVATEQEFRPVA